MPRTLTPLAEGFAFLESPRWRDGQLWVSDMHDDRVLTVDLAGRRTLFECRHQRNARIEVVDVDVPGAGLP